MLLTNKRSHCKREQAQTPDGEQLPHTHNFAVQKSRFIAFVVRTEDELLALLLVVVEVDNELPCLIKAHFDNMLV